jgi:hypothetical protein
MLANAWRIRGVCVLAASLALALALTAPAAFASAGTANVFVNAGSSLDPYTEAPSVPEQAWFATHVWRMTVYAPYFNERTGWFHNGWVYKDAYAIYPGTPEATEHTEWILKSASGEDLYIPWGCSGGSCPQYAGDIASASYRRAWIEDLSSELAHGYRGVFIDDVNMELDVGNGRGEMVAPIDPATGAPMTAEAWRGYMAIFMEEVRAALPAVEIVHNGVWYSDEDAGTANASIRAEIESANYYFLERGANDSGLTGGDGHWSLNAFLSFVEQVHAVGRDVVLDGIAEDEPGLAYNLACYFLVDNGNDGVAGGGQTPRSWWSGWNLDLGEAVGGRYTWQGLQRRNFTDGLVLVDPPGERSATVTLPAPMRNLQGETVSSVTITEGTAAILQGEGASSRSPIPTSTIVEAEPEPVPAAETIASPGASATEPVTIGGGAAASPQADAARSHRHPGRSPKRPAHAGRDARHRRSGRHEKAGSARARAASHASVQMMRIGGHVVNATAGETTIEVQARRGDRWVTVAHLLAHLNGRGRFVSRVSLRLGERYRLRAVYEGTSSFRPSGSAFRVLVPHAASTG